MNNSKFTNSPSKLNRTTSNPSKISIVEKIIIGILLVIAGFFIIAIAINLLRVHFAIPHNSIIVGGVRRNPFIGFHSVKYIIGVEESREIDGELPKNLGSDAEWSPDGQWIVSINDYRIFVMRADGSQRMLIPTPPYAVEQPTWSPDGKQIAYSAIDTNYGPGIFITNIECLLRGESCTPEFHILAQSKNGYTLNSPHWSPDGRQIIYIEPIDVYMHHIFSINADGKSLAIDLTPTYSGTIRQLRWSPNGTKIVGVCEGLYGEYPNICTMNRDGSNLISLTHDTKFTDIHLPRWSPNGQKIAYLSRISDEPFSGTCWDGCPYPNAIFIMNSDGSGIARLSSEDNVVIHWFTWYP